MPNWDQVVVGDEPGEATFINGRWMQGVHWTLGDEDHEKLKLGVKCIQCMEDWSHSDVPAFPDECPVCSFPVKESQMFEYEYGFKGFKEVGSRINADVELARLERQRFDRERREGLRTKGIVIPRNAKLE